MNTMSSSKTQTVGPSPLALKDRGAPKRQKTDHSGNYTQYAFALVADQDDTSRDRILKSERHGSQSATSTEEKTWDSGVVKEFRAVEGIHDPNRRHRTGNRSRPPRNRLIQFDMSMEAKDPIQDDSDESFTEPRAHPRPTLPGTQTQVRGSAKNRSAMDPAELAILGEGIHVPKSPAKQDFAHTINRTKRRFQPSDVNDEIDELAGDPDYQPQKRPNTGQNRQQPAKSASISTRGDLKPSFAAGHKPAPLEEEALPLKALVWARSQIYDASEPSTSGDPPERLVLRSHTESSDRALLRLHSATSTSEDSSEFPWFEIQSQMIDRVKIDHDSCTVRVTIPAKLDYNLGRTLYLRLHSKEDTHKLLLWFTRYSNRTVEPDIAGSLEKEFAKQFADIKKRPAPKATPVARSQADAEASRQAPGPGTAMPGTRYRQPRTRVIDVLDEASTVGSGPFGYPVGEDEVSEYPRTRRSVRTRRDPSSPAPVPLPDRWTEVHADWDKNWRLPLSFHRTAVEKDDIARLDEGQCLNDNIIGFYLKYLQVQAEKQRPETSKRIYFHNSFFYSKLKPTSGRHINYDGVKSWTAKVDIFSYDYIVVPVNEHFHWWVAIICNPGKLDSTVAEKAAASRECSDDIEEVLAASSSGNTAARSSPRHDGDVARQDRYDITAIDDEDNPFQPKDPFILPDSADERIVKETIEFGKGDDAATVIVEGDATPTTVKSAPQKGRKRGRKSMGAAQRKYNPADPRIITLDSLGASHSPVCTHLKQYLIAEFKDKKGKDVEYNQASIGMRATNIPEQNNFCDCGVYLLKYVAEFLCDPDKFIQSILLREGRQWDFDASQLRNDIRQLIFDLHDPYQKEQEEAKRQKALAKRKRERSKSEGPADGTGTPAPKSSAEAAVSPRKAVDPAPLSSRRTSPAVGSPASPLPLEQADVRLVEPFVKEGHLKGSPDAQQSGSMETAQYDDRSFFVVDEKQSRPAATQAQSLESPVQPSQPLPSIEIPDEEDVPVIPAQRPQASSRQASLSGGTGSAEGSDDKVVQVQLAGGTPSGFKSSRQKHGRTRSSSQTEKGASGLYRRAEAQPVHDDAVQELAKPASPAKKAPAVSIPLSPPTIHVASGQKPERSRFFEKGGWNRNEQPRVKKTYKGIGARKASAGGTIDLTED